MIVMTGPPGAGKTTVARQVADRLSLSVHLHADDFWHFIRQGAIAPYLPEAHHQNTIVIDVVARTAFGYAAGGYDVICDGISGPWFLDAFRAARTASGIELHYLVLRPDEATTLRRATSRTATDALTDPEPIRSLHHQFSSLDILEPHVLDSSGMDPAATAEVALRGIANGHYRLS
ncbi:conserved hypothetical protein [Parafrankia sp. Ea1.12]|nr:conserved hypothetical protein [Parafrankia sp. Ea1.12]